MAISACPSTFATASCHETREARQARELAKRDPDLAIDLRIGRPDRARSYDDGGGLVDLNSAAADVIVSVCGFDREVAERVVSRREEWANGFSSIEEALAYLPLSEREEGVLREPGLGSPFVMRCRPATG